MLSGEKTLIEVLGWFISALYGLFCTFLSLSGRGEKLKRKLAQLASYLFMAASALLAVYFFATGELMAGRSSLMGAAFVYIFSLPTSKKETANQSPLCH